MLSEHQIRQHGLKLLRGLSQQRTGPIRVFTHGMTAADAAWAPLAAALEAELPVELWLTTEPATPAAVHMHYVAAIQAGPLLQEGTIDLCLVAASSANHHGDVICSAGSYFLALAAHDLGIPFLVILPSKQVEWHSAANWPTAAVAEVLPARLISSFLNENGLFSPSEIERLRPHATQHEQLLDAKYLA